MISLQSQLELANSESKQLKELFETLKKNEDSMNEKMNELNDKYNKVIYKNSFVHALFLILIKQDDLNSAFYPSCKLSVFKNRTLLRIGADHRITYSSSKLFNCTSVFLIFTLARFKTRLVRYCFVFKATEEYHSMEEMHRNELQSQSRLAQLYKDSSEDAEKKSEELVSAVEELQALIKANSEGWNL